MKKIEINQEELDQMNYNDIAYIVLKEKGKKMKIIDLFHEVGKILNLDESKYQSHIADFFELLSTDKRFIMLDQGYWDLKVKHDKGMVIESEDEDEDELLIESEDNQDSEDYDDGTEDGEIDDDVEEDDLSDLVIIDENDEESNM